MNCTYPATNMSQFRLGLTLGTLLFAISHPLSSQNLLVLPDSAQRARARALCGPLAEDTLVLDPTWPHAGDLVSQSFAFMEPPRSLPARVVVEYPRSLRDRGIEGAVFLAAIIDTTGRIEANSVKVVATPHLDFLPAVHKYLYQLRFSPGRAHGHPVRVCVAMVIPFSLQQR